MRRNAAVNRCAGGPAPCELLEWWFSTQSRGLKTLANNSTRALYDLAEKAREASKDAND
jgi:hypothetical protein